jgi:hypothetical protein
MARFVRRKFLDIFGFGTGVVTAFATVWPATKLMLDATGMDLHGNTVKKPDPSSLATVTFNDARTGHGMPCADRSEDLRP